MNFLCCLDHEYILNGFWILLNYNVHHQKLSLPEMKPIRDSNQSIKAKEKIFLTSVNIKADISE